MGKIKNLKIYTSMFVSMPYFLYNYVGVNDKTIYKMSHSDIKKIMPNIKRYSITEVLKNPDMIYQGEVILVKDKKGIVVPYLKPTKMEEIKDQKQIIKKEKDKLMQEKIDIKKLSNYELKKEYKYQKNCHSFGKYKLTRIIKKELNNRGIKGPGRKRMLKEKLKGEIDYD